MNNREVVETFALNAFATQYKEQMVQTRRNACQLLSEGQAELPTDPNAFLNAQILNCGLLQCCISGQDPLSGVVQQWKQ